MRGAPKESTAIIRT